MISAWITETVPIKVRDDTYVSSDFSRVSVFVLLDLGAAHLRFLAVCGGPQGSIFGPLFFGIHTLPLAQIMDYYNILHHNSANVTQLHTANDYSALYLLSKCMNEIND